MYIYSYMFNKKERGGRGRERKGEEERESLESLNTVKVTNHRILISITFSEFYTYIIIVTILCSIYLLFSLTKSYCLL